MTAPLAEQVAAALRSHPRSPYLPSESAANVVADAVLRVVAEWLGSERAMEVAAVTLATVNADTRQFRGMPDAAVYPVFAVEVLEALRADVCPGATESGLGATNARAAVSLDPRGAQDGTEGRDGSSDEIGALLADDERWGFIDPHGARAAQIRRDADTTRPAGDDPREDEA